MMVPMGGGPGTCVQAINHTNCAAPGGDLS